MSTTQEQAKEFYDFVIQELSRYPANSLDELYDLWKTDRTSTRVERVSFAWERGKGQQP